MTLLWDAPAPAVSLKNVFFLLQVELIVIFKMKSIFGKAKVLQNLFYFF